MSRGEKLACLTLMIEYFKISRMGVEQLITRAFRVIPEGLRHRIVTGWANEASFLDRIHKEFEAAPKFDLKPPGNPQESKEIFLGAKDGYLIDILRDGQVNLQFTVEEILKRKDLVETEMGIGIFRLWGYFIFSENAASLLLPQGIRVVPLGLKTKGIELNLFAFDMPLESFTIQARGIEHSAVFTNSEILLYDTKNRQDRFAIHFSAASKIT